METNTKVVGGCYIIASLFFGIVFAMAFASLSESFGGDFQKSFWSALLPSMVLGLVVAICPTVLFAGEMFD